VGTELAAGRGAERQDEGLRRGLALVQEVLSDPRNAWLSAMPVTSGFRAPHALLGLKSAVPVRARDFLLDLLQQASGKTRFGGKLWKPPSRSLLTEAYVIPSEPKGMLQFERPSWGEGGPPKPGAQRLDPGTVQYLVQALGGPRQLRRLADDPPLGRRAEMLYPKGEARRLEAVRTGQGLPEGFFLESGEGFNREYEALMRELIREFGKKKPAGTK